MAYLGNTVTTQGFTPAIDYFNGDGTTTAFTLSRPVASVAQVQVVVNNVPQLPGTAFTVSSNTITFTGAPSAGTSNIYVYYTSPITQVIAPSQGTVSPTSLSTGAPSWDTSGNVTLTGNITLNNGAADGAQITLNSAGYSAWNWDNYSGRLRAYYGATEYFTIDTSGNVGIGTSSPVVKVQSSNGFLTNGSAAAFSANSIIVDVSSGLGRVTAAGADASTHGTLTFNTGSSNASLFTERMRIDSSGNVAIGNTSSSSRRLWVESPDNAVTLTAKNTNASFGQFVIGCDTTRAANSGFDLYLGQSNGVSQFRVNGAGTIYAQNTSVQSISDVRMKENIVDSNDGIDIINALRPVRFDFKNGFGNDRKNQLGFIAQEIEQVFPDAVDVWGESDDPETPYKSVGPSALIPVLVKAIQEQQALIQTLQTQVAQLQAKVGV